MADSKFRKFTLNTEDHEINNLDFENFLLALDKQEVYIEQTINDRKTANIKPTTFMAKKKDNFIYGCILKYLISKTQLEVMADNSGIEPVDVSRHIIMIPFIFSVNNGTGVFAQYYNSLKFNDFRLFMKMKMQNEDTYGDLIRRASLLKPLLAPQQLYDFVKKSMHNLDCAYFTPTVDNSKYGKIPLGTFDKNPRIRVLDLVKMQISGEADIEEFLKILEKEGLLNTLVKLHGKTLKGTSKTIDCENNENVNEAFTQFNSEDFTGYVQNYCKGKNLAQIIENFTDIPFYKNLIDEIHK